MYWQTGKIGFCLQTRNSFNLLWSQCKSRFKIIEAKPLMSAQERRRNSELTTLDSLNPNLVLLARQSLTISLSATGSHYKWSLHTPSSHLFTDPTHQYHRVVLAVFGLALASMWRLYFSICTRPWLSVFSGGYQRQTRDSGTIKQNGPFSLSLIIHKRYIYYIFYLEWKWSEDEKQEYFTLAQKITTTYSLELSAGVCVCAGWAGRAGSCVLLLLTANVVSTAECDNSDHMAQHEITLDRLSRGVLFNLKNTITGFNLVLKD